MVTTEQTQRRPGRPRRRAQNGAPRYHAVTLHLPPDLISDIDAQAQREGAENRSAMVRRVLAEYLRRQAKKAEYATTDAQTGRN